MPVQASQDCQIHLLLLIHADSQAGGFMRFFVVVGLWLIQGGHFGLVQVPVVLSQGKSQGEICCYISCQIVAPWHWHQ